MSNVQYVVNIRKTDKKYVYIGRPSKYGNPFTIDKDGDRKTVVKKYETWINKPAQSALRADIKKNLKGKILGCFCKPLACHGDIIAKIANNS